MKTVKVLSFNCCSLRSSLKKASLLALTNEHKPDIICGCESHLDESYLSAEIFQKTIMYSEKIGPKELVESLFV